MNLKRIITWLLIVSIATIVLVSCAPKGEPSPQKEEAKQKEEPAPEGEKAPEGKLQEETKIPAMPKPLEGKEGEEPRLKVYIHDEKKVEEMPFEDYIEGVVAGEIKNDWPPEAIKAQAIIARTFVLDFVNTKGKSKHNPEAHISTDIEEAQAWNSKEINEAIKKAVEETRGQVLTYNGEFTKTWFHSNAGGITADSKEGLNYKEGNPPYIVSVKSPDTGAEVPADERSWTASFSKENIVEALGKMGSDVADFQKVSIGKKGPSGRVVTLLFDDSEVSAPDFRVALDSMVMKSTLLDSLEYADNKLTMKGRGYGHGVGMSQWGAYFMAKEGKSSEEILTHYFKEIKIANMWK